MAKTSEYRLGEFAFPRGWFMAGNADELESGPIGVRYFGQDFALYRGKSGRVVMLDAYCPHMGTHLAKNTTSYVVRDGTQIDGDARAADIHAYIDSVQRTRGISGALHRTDRPFQATKSKAA